jgi:hypothetical protein
MFAMEKGKELWLAPLVTENWLRQGREFSVENLPTNFGPVSYRVKSRLNEGFIEATIEPPARTSPDALVLRLRRPDGNSIRNIEVEGADHAQIRPEGESIRITPGAQTIRLKAHY